MLTFTAGDPAGRPYVNPGDIIDMSNIFTSASRALFRWYLSKFPLRDGKVYFYEQAASSPDAGRTPGHRHPG